MKGFTQQSAIKTIFKYSSSLAATRLIVCRPTYERTNELDDKRINWLFAHRKPQDVVVFEEERKKETDLESSGLASQP